MFLAVKVIDVCSRLSATALQSVAKRHGNRGGVQCDAVSFRLTSYVHLLLLKTARLIGIEDVVFGAGYDYSIELTEVSILPGALTGLTLSAGRRRPP